MHGKEKSKLCQSKQTFKRKYEENVIAFLEHDDNGRSQSGKADKKKIGEEVKQTRVLTDYLENLHSKYLSGNPNTQVSLTTFSCGDYVAAVYNKICYIGRVIDKDDSDGEVEISFMEPKKYFFQLPSRDDNLWVKKTDVLCNVEKPKATGKSKRMFKISESDKVMIESC
jgi:hypothetical protein